jgi:hypothetical protein
MKIRKLTKAEAELLADAVLGVKFRAEENDENPRLAKRANRLWLMIDDLRVIQRG